MAYFSLYCRGDKFVLCIWLIMVACRRPVGKSHGHLQGQYVYLYYDNADLAWVMFLNNIGPVACCTASEGVIG
jgi:hypothetical protein